MLLEENIQKILDHLNDEQPLNLALDGADIWVRFSDHSSKMFLTTSVYYGGNYIPSSVRRCLSHKNPIFRPLPAIRTFLTVDEQHFQVHLNYLGQTQQLSRQALKELLEEFGTIAENWRLYLDEHDKHDLVHVRVK